MTTVTSITPRTNVDGEGRAVLAVNAAGVQVWDVEFSDANPIGFSAPTAQEAEAGALAYLAS